jgi:hypothetical protein
LVQFAPLVVEYNFNNASFSVLDIFAVIENATKNTSASVEIVFIIVCFKFNKWILLIGLCKTTKKNR